MKLYFIRRNIDGCYFKKIVWQPPKGLLSEWTREKDTAHFYRSQEEADARLRHLGDIKNEDAEVVIVDTDAAVLVLRDLFEVRDLGDYVYDIHEREGEGWEGPKVTKWGNAAMRGKELVNQYERDHFEEEIINP